MGRQEYKEKVCAETKACYSEKLFAGTSGNLSLYDPEEDLIYITPGSYPYEIMKPEDIMVIRKDGTVIDGPHKPSSEWRLHACIYQNMPDVRAVVHTHSPYATSFAVNHAGIPVILIEMVAYLGGDIPLAEFAVPGSDEVGETAVAAMRRDGRNACLMANHGVVAVGSTLPQAHVRATYVEDAAVIYSHALHNGLGVVTMAPEYIEAMKKKK